MKRPFESASGVVLGLLLTVTAAAGTIGIAFSSTRSGQIETVASVVGGFAFSIVGALIVLRHPRNLIGWAFCFGALAIELENAGGGYLEHARASDFGAVRSAAIVGLFADALWIPSLALGIIFTFLLFPDGRPLSSRWRPLVWAAATLGLVSLPLTLFAPGPLYYAEDIENPLGLSAIAGVIEEAQAVSLVGMMTLFFVSIGSVALRFRRSRGSERQQIKWFFYATALVAIGIPIAMAFESTVLGTILVEVVLMAIPASVAIAILRYRLYDIDLVINRTLVYAILTGLLALAYVGIVVVLQGILAPVTRDSDLAVAGSTLAVAALFRPLRTRVQGFIDRRFYRRKYDASETLESFSSRLRDEVDLDSLSQELVTVVGSTMQPAHASLWLREPEEVA